VSETRSLGSLAGSFPAYPVLAAAYFVLRLAAHNTSELIQFGDLLNPLAISIMVVAILWALGWVVTRTVHKGAMVATIGLALFSFFSLLGGALGPGVGLIGGPVGLVIFLLYVTAVAALVIRRVRREFAGVTQYMNLVTALLLGFSVYGIARDASVTGPSIQSLSSVGEVRANTGTSTAGLPDIFLIIVDKYTGSLVLREHYGFDNSPFEDILRKRGFVVPSHARTNYIHTALVLAAMLNLRYLDSLPEGLEQDDHYWAPIYPMIEHNEVALYLKKRGYRYVFFPTAFPPTRQSRIADAQLPSPTQIRPEFEMIWLRTTPIPVLHAATCAVVGCTTARTPYVPESASLLDWKFSRVPELAGTSQPVFAFVHLTLPHEPYVYDRRCAHREPYWPLGGVRDTPALKQMYIDQIECLNRKLLTMVDQILRRSHRPPVIVIQSDHGHGRPGVQNFSLDQLPPERVVERTSIFAAYALPGIPDSAISNSISPVNVMRMVLREYLGADLPVLPDVTYWSAWGRPYRFTRVQ
jgi:hypothetical protein